MDVVAALGEHGEFPCGKMPVKGQALFDLEKVPAVRVHDQDRTRDLTQQRP